VIEPLPSARVVPPECGRPDLCPLSQVRAGTAVRIRQLAAAPEVSHRLRELGICEDQQIKLLSRQANVICLVCNVRLCLSAELADAIWVEPVAPRPHAA
jgi:Fe2+ transport system protein FeoA